MEVVMPKLLKSICLISFLLFFGLTFVFAEDITITTYYPSPYGVYNQLQTQTMGIGDNNGNGSLDSGDIPNPATNPGTLWVKGNLGIGTIVIADPQIPLDVAGGIKPGHVEDGVCRGETAGAIRWSADDLELQYCDGTNWQSIQRGGMSASCTPNEGPYTWDYQGCSCGSGGYIWQSIQYCTCSEDGTWWNCIPDCNAYKPADIPC
jgi:hypothetical protein